MTAVARTLSSLSPEAHTAVWAYAEFAGDYADQPAAKDPIVRLSVLIQLLRAAGGTWADVEDLLALHDDELDEFLNEHHARTVWSIYGGTFPDFVLERTAA